MPYWEIYIDHYQEQIRIDHGTLVCKDDVCKFIKQIVESANNLGWDLAVWIKEDE